MQKSRTVVHTTPPNPSHPPPRTPGPLTEVPGYLPYTRTVYRFASPGPFYVCEAFSVYGAQLSGTVGYMAPGNYFPPHLEVYSNVEWGSPAPRGGPSGDLSIITPAPSSIRVSEERSLPVDRHPWSAPSPQPSTPPTPDLISISSDSDGDPPQPTPNSRKLKLSYLLADNPPAGCTPLPPSREPPTLKRPRIEDHPPDQRPNHKGLLGYTPQTVTSPKESPESLRSLKESDGSVKEGVESLRGSGGRGIESLRGSGGSGRGGVESLRGSGGRGSEGSGGSLRRSVENASVVSVSANWEGEEGWSKEEECILFSIEEVDIDRSILLGKKPKFSSKVIQVRVIPKPFAVGSERSVYYMKTSEGERWVLKQYKHLAKNGNDLSVQMTSQRGAIGRYLAKEFMKIQTNYKIEFIPIHYVYFPNRSVFQYFSVEKYISQKIEPFPNGSEDPLVLIAFSHFTWQFTKHSLLANFKGSKIPNQPTSYLISSSTLNTTKRNLGDSSKGMKGITDFFNTHKTQCTSSCQILADCGLLSN